MDPEVIEMAARELRRRRQQADMVEPVKLSDSAVASLQESTNALREVTSEQNKALVKAVGQLASEIVATLSGVSEAVSVSSKATGEAIGRLEKATKPTDLSGIVKAIEMATAAILTALDKPEPIKEEKPPVQFNVQRDENGYMKSVVVGEYKPATPSKAKLTIN